MSVVETFHGYIETTQDTLLIFEACRRGLLPRICRRLQEKERRIIQSGTVFVFDERESGIKRWTDGLVWSPSRILGNFLVYRELDKHTSGKKNTGPIDRASRASSSDAESAIEKNKERALVGSLTNSYRFKKQGLIKKTMSIVVNGVSQHMISYYSKEDVLAGKLRTPSSVPELASLEISPEFLMKQNFRIPPTVEQSYDHMSEHMHSPVSSHSPRTPTSMGAGGPDFSAGYGHHQETHSTGHHQQGYHGVPHLGEASQQHQHQQHHTPHPYSPQHATFPSTFGYGHVPGTPGASEVSATQPPHLRYAHRSHPLAPYSPHSPSQPSFSQQMEHQHHHHHHHQDQHHQQRSHHTHSLSSGAAPSPLTVSTSDHSSNSAAHDLMPVYHSPVTNESAGTFGQQHHQPSYYQTPLPPSTQGWGDFGYSSYSTPTAALGSIPDHHHHEPQEQSASP
ncbi:hypothetical protein KVV02_007896 [Mortierella alpina]|uniref:cAMP-independent regulatory protein pac2 n=1 Tax=Mortierella alpina TaxID=64518 RepID=A0A9P7ZZR2_MORAP|nr:hypothetical protein KVV02_007896 [Mortierella alpina]